MSDWKEDIIRKSDEHQRNIARENRGRAVHNVPAHEPVPEKPVPPKEVPAKEAKK